jgi:hypothetical protein
MQLHFWDIIQKQILNIEILYSSEAYYSRRFPLFEIDVNMKYLEPYLMFDQKNKNKAKFS